MANSTVEFLEFRDFGKAKDVAAAIDMHLHDPQRFRLGVGAANRFSETGDWVNMRELAAQVERLEASIAPEC